MIGKSADRWHVIQLFEIWVEGEEEESQLTTNRYLGKVNVPSCSRPIPPASSR